MNPLAGIPIPHNSRVESSIAVMKKGKQVWCEKLMAINSSQLNAMMEISKENNVYLMEAFWSRFNPGLSEIKGKNERGLNGESIHIKADFSHKQNLEDITGRNFNIILFGAIAFLGFFILL